MRYLSTSDELADFIENVFGDRADVLGIIPELGRVRFLLYDAFVITAEVEPHTGVFGMGLSLASDVMLSRMLGVKFSLNNDEASIRASFDTIDEYCRLRLPDKYLEAFEQRVLGGPS